MYLVAIALAGALIGGWRAKKRGGKPGDIATWAIGHGIAFVIAVVVVLMLYDFITNWFI